VDFDIVIAGAGPVGLSLARALAGTGLRLALVEARDPAELQDSAFARSLLGR
jgi:2-polyprenyl-6-methoxyphenol hydroxylase-like FAD-dependent oxidoreductase